MTLSLLIRMGIGLIVFVLMARGLGPQQFGFISAVFAYASIGALLTDFGFSAKMLRDIAASPERGSEFLSTALSIKIVLATTLLVIGSVVICTLPIGAASKIAAIFLAGGLMIAAVGDLALVTFRARARYSSEAWITAWTSLAYLSLIGPVSLLHCRIEVVAAFFLASRLLYAGVAVVRAKQTFPEKSTCRHSLGATLKSLQGAAFWALDAGLGYLNGQLDTLLVVSTFGLSSTGIYQSGARFVQSALVLSTMLYNIHVPALAAQGLSPKFSVRERRIVLEYLVVGGSLALGIWLGGPLVTRVLLGKQYADVDALWPGFAVFVLGRFLAGAFGTSLVAFGAPRIRVVGQLFTVITIVCGFTFLPNLELKAVPFLMAAGTLVTIALYSGGRVYIGFTAVRRCTSASNHIGDAAQPDL